MEIDNSENENEHGLKINALTSTAIQSDPPDFISGFAVLQTITIVLGSTGGKCLNAVSWVSSVRSPK